MHFKNLRVDDLDSVDISDPVPVGTQETQDLDVDQIINDGDGGMSITREIETEEIITNLNRALGGFSINFQQEIFYGKGGEGAESGGVGGKTTFGAEVKAEFENQNGTSNRKTKTHAITETIPAHRKLILTQRRTKGAVKQTIKTTGTLTYDLDIDSNNDWAIGTNKEESMQTLIGYGIKEGEHYKKEIVEFFSKSPLPQEEVDSLFNEIKGLKFQFEDTIEYDKATTGHVIVSEDEIASNDK